MVELAETTISTADLIGLRVGDIIASEKDIHEPLVVSIEGRPKFSASPGQFKGRKAIEILQVIEEHHLAVSTSKAALPRAAAQAKSA